MQRAAQKNSVTHRTKPLAPPPGETGSGWVEIVEPVAIDRPNASPSEPAAAKPAVGQKRGLRCKQLEKAIRQRVESRLAGRIRHLVVRVSGDTVVLEGQCSTYYSKQLAQHAALGVLEDEQLRNEIVVNVPR